MRFRAHRLFSLIWHTLLYILEKILGTRFQEWRWAIRHILKGSGWAQSYIRDVHHPHRTYLIKEITSYAPLNTAFEIGCNAGPNLYLLAKKFPDMHFYGIDINTDAIARGKKWLKEQNISSIDLAVGRADNLKKFQDKSIDVVFTDAMLMYVGPDKIKKVLSEMARIARKAIILHEFYDKMIGTNDPFEGRSYDAHWIYNYERCMRTLLPLCHVEISDQPKKIWGDAGWKEYGSLIKITIAPFADSYGILSKKF